MKGKKLFDCFKIVSKKLKIILVKDSKIKLLKLKCFGFFYLFRIFYILFVVFLFFMFFYGF